MRLNNIVSIEIWDIATPGSGLQRSRHFAGWAPGRDADLRAVRAEVQAVIEAADANSKAFQPQAASLLLLGTDWNADAETWPLRPELFDVAVQDHEIVVELDGTDLETMRRFMPGYRRTHFVREGHRIEATLIPWLPDQDWSEDIEGFAPAR